MASVNKVIIVGNLGADPDVRTFDNGGKIATISVATSERWTDKQTGEMREHTEWHRIVFNNRLADIAEQYLRKGSQVYVEGSLRTRKWQDNQTGQDRYTTEIRADIMQMLGHKNSGGFGGQNDHQGGYQNNPQNNYQGGYQNQNAYQAGNQFQNPANFNAPQQAPYPQNNQNPNFTQTPAQNGFVQTSAPQYNQNAGNPNAGSHPNATNNHFGNAPVPATAPSQLNDDDDMPF